jgi:hypothetical protein
MPVITRRAISSLALSDMEAINKARFLPYSIINPPKAIGTENQQKLHLSPASSSDVKKCKQ